MDHKVRFLFIAWLGVLLVTGIGNYYLWSDPPPAAGLAIAPPAGAGPGSPLLTLTPTAPATAPPALTSTLVLPSPTIPATRELPTAPPPSPAATPNILALDLAELRREWLCPQPTPTPTAPPPPIPAEHAFASALRPLCQALLENVPALAQRRSLSCEAAATRIVLAGRGVAVSEEEILRRMGSNPNPHLGFRGNVDGYGYYANLRNYGAYAEVVAHVLGSLGVQGQVVYGLSDAALREAVRRGQAAIVWLTARNSPRVIQGPGYRLVEGEHVYVVVGVAKDGRFLVHDPWRARYGPQAGTYFVAQIPQWDLFQRMAVLVPVR